MYKYAVLAIWTSETTSYNTYILRKETRARIGALPPRHLREFCQLVRGDEGDQVLKP